MCHRQVTNFLFFQSQCNILHQLQICHLLVFHISKVVLSSSWNSQPTIAFQVRHFVNQGWFFIPFGIHNLPIGLILFGRFTYQGCFPVFACLYYQFTVIRHSNHSNHSSLSPSLFPLCRHELFHFGMARSSRPDVFCEKGVNFAKFLRAPFFTEHLRWLLLYG